MIVIYKPEGATNVIDYEVSGGKNIDFDDYTEAIPAFLTIIFMVCASSVSDGIMFGVMTYVLLKALSGRRKEIRGMTWIVFGIFTLKVVLDYFGLFVE